MPLVIGGRPGRRCEDRRPAPSLEQRCRPPGGAQGPSVATPGLYPAERAPADHQNPGLHQGCTPGTFWFRLRWLDFAAQKIVQADHGGTQGECRSRPGGRPTRSGCPSMTGRSTSSSASSGSCSSRTGPRLSARCGGSSARPAGCCSAPGAPSRRTASRRPWRPGSPTCSPATPQRSWSRCRTATATSARSPPTWPRAGWNARPPSPSRWWDPPPRPLTVTGCRRGYLPAPRRRFSSCQPSRHPRTTRSLRCRTGSGRPLSCPRLSGSSRARCEPASRPRAAPSRRSSRSSSGRSRPRSARSPPPGTAAKPSGRLSATPTSKPGRSRRRRSRYWAGAAAWSCAGTSIASRP